MTRETFYTRSLHAFMEYCLGRSRAASRAQVDLSETRALQRLRQDPMWESDAPLFEAAPSALRRKPQGLNGISAASTFRRKSAARWAPVAAAAVVITAVVFTRPWRNDPLAVAIADGVFELQDGSRVEMHPQSDLSFERADDGVRIRLNRGGIIVNAAKQRKSHLYVQTKDLTASVVGTVFLVNAEEQGSRVAVIEGEVRVQQGAIERNLRRGEQVTSSAAMQPQPVVEGISWSRNAGVLAGLLQQSAVAAPALATQNQTSPRETFEVASIRIGSPTPSGGGRGRPANGACEGRIQIDPSRVAITGATLNYLVTLAYGYSTPFGDVVGGCAGALEKKRLSGGPDWVGSDRFDIEAKIPPGPVPYAEKVIDSRGGVERRVNPRLLEMLRALLESRFNLVVRREQRNVPVYLLVAAPGGSKLTASKEGEPAGSSVTRNGSYDGYKNGIAAPKPYGDLHVGHISARRGTMAILAGQIGRFTTDRIVLDRTGITGEFNYELFFVPFGPVPDGRSPLTSPTLEGALREELGLELKPLLEAVEFLAIERVERPTEN
jgi:uncharacterized protein (TIGR03435 family)